MEQPGKIKLFSIACIMTLLFYNSASGADKVVVVPLGGTVGNAVVSDVLKGKTFSSKTAGKGKTGTLEIRAGSTIYTNSVGMKFSRIPAGSFVMGSPEGTGDATHRPIWPAEGGLYITDERQHIVTLSDSFYMQTTELTQGQWLIVMGGANPSHFNTCGMNCPVEDVSWDDAQNFIDALNTRENRTNCNTLPNTCYSLPTEAQWEYAARAGTVTAFYNGDIIHPTGSDPHLDKIGWYDQNSSSTTHPVAQKQPNNWGLYDMSGNVWEWCQDLFGTYPDGPVTDPTGAVSGLDRVVRGGSWGDLAGYVRSACHGWRAPGGHDGYLGFRLLLPPGQ
jgi:formylglycine-generating enzyme required for sulfatase activity